MESFRNIAERIILYPWTISQCADELARIYEPAEQGKTIEDCLNKALDTYARDFDHMDKEEQYRALGVHIGVALKKK